MLERVVQGLTNKEIALQLGLSPRTIEIYRGGVMHKLGARDAADFVRKVVAPVDD